MNRVQSNAMVSQAWTDWVLVSPGSSQILALLSVAQGLYPGSPHIQTVQQVITVRQPPAPGARPRTMSGNQVKPAPGSKAVPRTLNEITQNTSTAPPHIGNQPGVIHQQPPSAGSKTLTDVRQLNPLLPSATPPVSQQTLIPGSRSARPLQHFLQPSQAGIAVPSAEQQPAARRLPPMMNQTRPPTFYPAPRVPGGFGDAVGRGGGRGGDRERGR